MINRMVAALKLAALFCTVRAIEFFVVILNLNIEKWAESKGYDKIYDFLKAPPWLESIYNFLFGPFGAGLSLGAIIFSFPNPITLFWEYILPSNKKKQQRYLSAEQCRKLAGDMNQFFADQQEPAWPSDEIERNSDSYSLAFQRHYEARGQRFQSRFASRAGEVIETAATLISVSDYEKHEATNFTSNTHLQRQQARLFAKIVARLDPVIEEKIKPKASPKYQFELRQIDEYWVILLTNRGKSDTFTISMDLSETPDYWSGKPLGLVKAGWGNIHNTKSEKLIAKNTRDAARLYATFHIPGADRFVQSKIFYVDDNSSKYSISPQWRGNNPSDPMVPKGQFTLHVSQAGDPQDVRKIRLNYYGVALSIISSEVPEREPEINTEQ